MFQIRASSNPQLPKRGSSSVQRPEKEDENVGGKSRHQLAVRKKFKVLTSASCSDGEGNQPVLMKTECLDVLSILAEFCNGSCSGE